MFHRNLLGVLDPPPLFPTTLVTMAGPTCADPRSGSWFGRMARQHKVNSLNEEKEFYDPETASSSGIPSRIPSP